MPVAILECAMKAKQEILLSQKRDIWESARVGWFYFLNTKVKRKFKKLTEILRFSWEKDDTNEIVKRVYEKYKKQGLIK